MLCALEEKRTEERTLPIFQCHSLPRLVQGHCFVPGVGVLSRSRRSSLAAVFFLGRFCCTVKTPA